MAGYVHLIYTRPIHLVIIAFAQQRVTDSPYEITTPTHIPRLLWRDHLQVKILPFSLNFVSFDGAVLNTWLVGCFSCCLVGWVAALFCLYNKWLGKSVLDCHVNLLAGWLAILYLIFVCCYITSAVYILLYLLLYSLAERYPPFCYSWAKSRSLVTTLVKHYWLLSMRNVPVPLDTGVDCYHGAQHHQTKTCWIYFRIWHFSELQHRFGVIFSILHFRVCSAFVWKSVVISRDPIENFTSWRSPQHPLGSFNHVHILSMDCK